MASSNIRPHMVVADAQGNIYDHPELLMVCRHGEEFALPKPDELIPLPEESELFLLPNRHALGCDPETGELEVQEDLAVAAFVAPAYTLTAHPAWAAEQDLPPLPLFAYGAIGFANNRFYVCAKKVDTDPRQVFKDVPVQVIRKKATALMKRFPENRLMQHLMKNCALTYNCPAARNLCLGRYEAPLPVSKACNARCVGCISRQEEGSGICASPQNRLVFTPTAEEIAEVMHYHCGNEKEAPIYSFGQGCEGEPLTEADLIASAIRLFRQSGGTGTVNLNTNASLPEKIGEIAEAGLTSMRVSVNSLRPEPYNRYYRPVSYAFEDVLRSIRTAKEKGVYCSLNLLYFPGFTDTEKELEAILEVVGREGVDCIQLRNLNIDPDMYLRLMQGVDTGPHVGFFNFRKRLKKEFPELHLGYFNPPVDEVSG